MHLRGIHAEPSHSALRAFIRENPLGLLITSLPGSPSNHPTIQATHIPWVINDPEPSSSHDDDESNNLGILRAHLARANPQVKALEEAVAAAASASASGGSSSSSSPIPGTEVSIMFTSSTHSYVPPRFYTETKPTTGKVVPTWNYAATQAWGKIRLFSYTGQDDDDDDKKKEETDRFLTEQTARLSDEQEEAWQQNNNRTGGGGGGGQGKPPPKPKTKKWKVSDAPGGYVKVLKKAIVGVEVEITRLEGKWKMSQEMSQGDRDGVVEGFRGLGTDEGVKMAGMVVERERLMREKKNKKEKEEGEA